jgi:hypothetical protein
VTSKIPLDLVLCGDQSDDTPVRPHRRASAEDNPSVRVGGRGNPPDDDNSGGGSGVSSVRRLRRAGGPPRRPHRAALALHEGIVAGFRAGTASGPSRFARFAGRSCGGHRQLAGGGNPIRVPVRRGPGRCQGAGSPGQGRRQPSGAGSPGAEGDQDFTHTQGAGQPVTESTGEKRTRPPGVTPTGEQIVERRVTTRGRQLVDGPRPDAPGNVPSDRPQTPGRPSLWAQTAGPATRTRSDRVAQTASSHQSL